MLRFVLTRISLVVPTFIGITLLTFFIIRLIPGDPIELLAGEHGIDPARHELLRHQFGFDRPVLVQYADYVGKILHGDLGESLSTRQPVLREFGELFPAETARRVLTVSELTTQLKRLLEKSIGLVWVTGEVTNLRVQSSGHIYFTLKDANAQLSCVLFRGESVEGRQLLQDGQKVLLQGALTVYEPRGQYQLRVLAVEMIVLGTIPLAVIARMTRSSMLEVLNEDYIRTARAKGLSPPRVVWIHALRNALIPVVTVIGLQVGTLMGGAILTEHVFSWPGVGHWLIESIARRDYPILQTGVLLIACVVILVNLFVDLLYGLINPRIRQAGH